MTHYQIRTPSRILAGVCILLGAEVHVAVEAVSPAPKVQRRKRTASVGVQGRMLSAQPDMPPAVPLDQEEDLTKVLALPGLGMDQSTERGGNDYFGSIEAALRAS